MFKYEKLFTDGEKDFAYAKDLGDWKECFDWYKNHKFLGKKTSFAEWLPYMLTQSVKYIHETWEFYCEISMEEMAMNTTYSKEECLCLA